MKNRYEILVDEGERVYHVLEDGVIVITGFLRPYSYPGTNGVEPSVIQLVKLANDRIRSIVAGGT